MHPVYSMEYDVELKLTGLKKFRASVKNPSSPLIQKVLKQWAAIYRSFVQRRFVRFSKGGGTWAKLKPATIRARRGKGKGVAILRDTNTMFRALDPVFRGAPGALEKPQGFSVLVGYGGPGKHPGGRATVADIARFHNFGMGNLPKRKIIERPDQKTTKLMAKTAEKTLQQQANKDIGNG